MNAVELHQVCLELGDHAVLENVDLEIGSNEFIGVLGPNGSGKTTLMRAILGLVPQKAGAIEVLGRPASRGNAAIGYMPQLRSGILGTGISGRDFVSSAMNGQKLGWPFPNRSERIEIDRALDLVGARKLAQRPLAELSGGERQRILLAQAVMGRPRLLLLDEPLISLDPRHQHDVVELVKALRAELKITVLFSAHELNPLMGAIDRVLYLGNKQAALGTVDEIITGPVLSRLYGAEIKVVRFEGHIFVMSDGQLIEREDHRHDDHGAHAHSHGHAHDHGHGHAHGEGADHA